MKSNRILSLFTGVLALGLLFIGPLLLLALPAQAYSTSTPWVLMWSDDFSGASLDTSKWIIDDHPGIAENGELQYYAPDDVSVQNGNLVLKTEQRNYNGYAYTSGEVNTNDKLYFTYGKIDIRAQLARGKGLWPSFWTFQSSAVWPPEIDIVEMLGQQPTTLYQTYHYVNHNRNTQSQTTLTVPDTSAGFHTYGIEWEPSVIRWYFDGGLTKTYTGSTVGANYMYLILDEAVGGSWAGTPDGTTVLPAYTYIDSVNFYQRQDSGTPPTAPTSLTSTGQNDTTIVLSWSASTDDVDVVGYDIYQGATLVGSTTTHLSYAVSGLSPSTAYTFTVKARDRMGNVSGPSNTLTASTLSAGSGNQALVRPATASSKDDASRTADKAVDGDLTSRWSSAFSDPQWIQVDLGTPHTLSQVVLRWEAAYGKAYQIQTSNDATNWTTIYSTTNGAGGTETLNVSGSGRYVRLYGTVRGTVYGYSLWEFEVYSPSGPTPTPGPTNTSAPPTNTPTKTNTPVATATPSPTPTFTNTPSGPTNTPTNTSVAQTNTPTHTPTRTNTPAPTATPGGATVMHVVELITTDSVGVPKSTFNRGDTVYYKAKIVDQSGNPVSGATVDFDLRYPDGSLCCTASLITDSTGWTPLWSKKTGNNYPIGTYTLNVTGVTKIGATYDPAANVISSTTFVLQ